MSTLKSLLVEIKKGRTSKTTIKNKKDSQPLSQFL